MMPKTNSSTEVIQTVVFNSNLVVLEQQKEFVEQQIRDAVQARRWEDVNVLQENLLEIEQGIREATV